ncbi:MAG: efflux RND transporter permease subunit [Pseudomonadota bacterium]
MNRTIRWFVDSRVAANLLAFFLVFAGLFSATTLTIRLFPGTVSYAVSIIVPYPGASPEEVEEGIVEPIEEQIEGIEDVREIDATAAENQASIVVNLDFGSDTDELATEIRDAVNQITVFPEESEEPQISEIDQDEQVAQVLLYGPREAMELKKIANEVRDRLLNYDSMSRVVIEGVPDYLIDIEIPSARLEALGLSLNQIASLIGERSLELSGGEIENREQRLLVRTLGKAEVGEEFGSISLLTSAAGTPTLLSEIASIDDGLSDEPIITRYNAQPAIALNIYRIGEEQTFAIITDVKEMIAQSESVLPPNVQLELFDDNSKGLRDRIGLLVTNAILGFILILALLLLFLDVRVAFWVGVGVAISFVGTFIPMQMAGITINQLSIFAFILAIGIVVDDAIVVGENIYATVEGGEEDPKQAAKRGTERVAAPVFFSVSTTVVAFLPLMFVPSTVGQFISDIAFVVCAVLVLSLVESFFILPKHLSHLHDRKPKSWSVRRWADPLRNNVAKRLDNFSEQRLRPAITFAATRPWATILFAVAILVVTLSLFSGGVIRQIFFPEIEGNFVSAELELAEGTSQDQTLAAAQVILDSAEEAARIVADDANIDPDDVIEGIVWSLGSSINGSGLGEVSVASGASANAGFFTVKIQDAAERRFTAIDFEAAWRQATGRIPGAQKLTFSYSLTSSALPVEILVLGTDDDEARAAVKELRTRLEEMRGVFDVTDDRFRTTDEVQISLRPEAAAFGVDLQTVAQAVRASYFGAEATRIQRDREEIEVRVRLPENERATIEDIKRQKIMIAGEAVPIAAVANITVGQAPAAITRLDGKRLFSLKADVDPNITTGGAITARLLGPVWDEVRADFPNVTVKTGGDQEEQARAMPPLIRNFVLALFAIYVLLALAFRSYSQPFVVMSVIPFGLIGAFWGHAMLGLDISLLSIFGIIGLSGVIINDALLMVDYINEKLGKGLERIDAVVDAAIVRFRPIILTSLTTFFGVTPIVLEQSVQAAFLKPTAVSLGFGILFGTAVLMLIVPAVAVLHLKAKAFFAKLTGGVAEEPAAA